MKKVKILYLRTQFYFKNVGGSVGHTSGVVNGFDLQADLSVVSNSLLSGVKRDITLIKAGILKQFPEIVGELLYNFRVKRKLKNKISTYDYLYHRFSEFSFSAAKLSDQCDVKLILEFNSFASWKWQNWSKNKPMLKRILIWLFILPIVRRIENYNLKRADLFVVVSQVLKDQLCDKGIQKDKILVNPNGVDPEKFNPEISAKELIKKHSLEDKTIIGFIGTFGVWHGVENLLEAYILLLKKNPDYRNTTKLMLIGDGKLMFQVKNRIEEENISDNVIVTGLVPQNEGPKYLSCCDILCAPTKPNPDGSRFFGSPTKLFEYMAMGKAIVSSDIEQQGEILEHQKDAILTKPGDVSSLAEGITQLLEDSLLRDTLGRNARKKVIENYTWEKHTRKILDSLNELQN
ncbi:glycosyltransferase family 4 protein [Draconibacterium sediminis]|mgnify:CR=1 FL=1|uniref:glycosyltransferase family 4 protein n=1 Tax=Draconibacterium sediminis TaxID=1544798 RepID=UPI0026F28EB8|nr:glycosyltransferase family 4 protein [Draconibacterium sediminis]